MKKILIISTGSENVSYDDRLRLTEELADTLDVSIETVIKAAMLEDLVFTIIDGRLSVSHDGMDITEFDILYVKNWFGHDHVARSLAEYARQQAITLICSETLDIASKEKLSEACILVGHGLPYPNTLFSMNGSRTLEVMGSLDTFQFPLIVKSITGFKGKDNYLVASESELKKLLVSDRDNVFMVQEFIPNDGDYRLIVMGDEVVFAMLRTRVDNTTHLNNTSQGGNAQVIKLSDIPEVYIQYAVSAAQSVRREIAGVDLLVSSNGDERVVICEVNASPQLQTGAHTDKKLASLARYLERLSRQPIEMMTPVTIGVSSLVDFTGYRNLKQIPARIDTGARTSSLWASDVRIKDGIATFKLFGPGSPWYTGKVVRRRVIELRDVTNSTGHTQTRHLVSMSIRIHGRRLNAKFTLSDRSTQMYPILVGRNTLRRNFLVDSSDPGEARLYRDQSEINDFKENEAI